MFADFCVGKNVEKNLTVRLDSVYHLRADASYQVRHEPLPAQKQVLLYVTDGTGFLKEQKKEFHLKRGDVLLFCPDQTEFFYQTQGDLWEFWWFEFWAEGLTMERDRLFCLNQDSFLERQCQNCLTLLQNENFSLGSSMFCGILAEFLLQIRQIWGADPEKEQFLKACQVIHEELGTINVSGAASSVGMGERELRTLFWKQCGMPPKKYILSVRLDMACFMMRNTSKTLGEISEILGFSSQFHFSRAFREAFGVAPNVWRKDVLGI